LRRLGAFSQELYAAEEIDLFRRLKRLARREGRTIAILHRQPLATSGRTLRDPKECFSWYDGRR
jgi:hypothetical protein